MLQSGNRPTQSVGKQLIAQTVDDALARRLAAARAGGREEFEALAEPYRRELVTHCYRMLGSFHDAEDMAQETFLRAWRRLDSYEGRGSFRAWLYKIATNVCLDALDRRPRRVLPPALRPASSPSETPMPPVSEPIWLEPFPDELLAPGESTPEARYDAHESITLAFLTALQLLSPRQRAVLILCDVLEWSAKETAGILEMSLSAANSILHRARAALAKHYTSRWHWDRGGMLDPEERALLGRYVSAWEALDIDALVSLIKEDANLTMPPLPLWYQGRLAIRDFFAANLFTPDMKGRLYMRPLTANGQPAFAWYLRDETSGAYHAYVLQVLTLEAGLIAEMNTFGFPDLFPRFGLAPEIALYDR